MDFRIADTFTDSLARLTGEEQKADIEELQRALDFPWDKWTVFALSPHRVGAGGGCVAALELGGVSRCRAPRQED
ncbi:MAG: hypothetical protein HW416_3964, partial [Chloroflexi bacterium]|nr:hypothetical protein [Chloroflexota bacterium]